MATTTRKTTKARHAELLRREKARAAERPASRRHVVYNRRGEPVVVVIPEKK